MTRKLPEMTGNEIADQVGNDEESDRQDGKEFGNGE